jgi:hypothetical protein
MELRLIKGTDSPSRRYSLAWGVPRVDHIDKLTNDDFERVFAHAHNYLVEKKTLRIVGTRKRTQVQTVRRFLEEIFPLALLDQQRTPTAVDDRLPQHP